MRTKLQKKLFEKYPKIFQGVHKTIQESLMPFGINTSDGWYWLIDQLCQALQYSTERLKEPQVVAFQIKEKFGGLRFYTTGASTRQLIIIDFAENLSYTICENCGSTDDVEQTRTGWILTYCKACRDKIED